MKFSNQSNKVSSFSRNAFSQGRQFGNMTLAASLTALLLCGGGMTFRPMKAKAQTNIGPLAQATAQATTQQTVIYVNSAQGSDRSGAGLSEATAYRTISYALQQAKAGTIIQLANGTYSAETGENFPLNIPSKVTLRGNISSKGQGVMIVGGGSHVSASFARQNVTVVALDEAIVEGVTITNTLSRGTGLWIEQGKPTIANNTFANSLREGIFVTGNAQPTISSNLFIKNDASGISVTRAAKGVIRDNTFQETGYGLAIGDTSAPLVSNNGVFQNKAGIVVSNSATPILRNNVISNNLAGGVVVIGFANPDLGTVNDQGNNRIRNNGSSDVLNSTSNLLVAIGNDINPNGIQGNVNFVPLDVQVAFSDVQGHWAQSYITALAKRGVISGFPDGTYRPNDPVTRAQFAAIVNKAFAPKPIRISKVFADVTSTFWGADAIQTAYRGGFLAGYPGDIFRPNQEIPKVQALVALTSGLGLPEASLNLLSRYSDAAQIPDYAKNAIASATASQLVVNYPNLSQFNPNQQATRAEVAAFVYQALVKAGQAEVIPSPYVVATP